MPSKEKGHLEYHSVSLSFISLFANKSAVRVPCTILARACFLTVVTCGVVLIEEDLQRLTEHDLLNDKVNTGMCGIWYAIKCFNR